jgi:hypothetical protein
MRKCSLIARCHKWYSGIISSRFSGDLLLHEGIEELHHLLIVVYISHPANILVRINDYASPIAGVNAVVCICLTMALMIRIIIHIYFLIVPTHVAMIRMEQFGEIQKFDLSLWPSIDCQDLNHAVN